MYYSIQVVIQNLIQDFNSIPLERKIVLEELARFIESKINADEKALLNFICTHNSRRSQMAQLWAQAAAYYYGVAGVECFSGGTESTSFNPRAVQAMQGAGFRLTKTKEGDNSTYEVRFSDDAPSIFAFSKKYDDPVNPEGDFAAIMTCSQADQNCPFMSGASVRFAIAYDDPKDFDDTPSEEAKYNERVRQIGSEILFAFSRIIPKRGR